MSTSDSYPPSSFHRSASKIRSRASSLVRRASSRTSGRRNDSEERLQSSTLSDRTAADGDLKRQKRPGFLSRSNSTSLALAAVELPDDQRQPRSRFSFRSRSQNRDNSTSNQPHSHHPHHHHHQYARSTPYLIAHELPDTSIKIPPNRSFLQSPTPNANSDEDLSSPTMDRETQRVNHVLRKQVEDANRKIAIMLGNAEIAEARNKALESKVNSLEAALEDSRTRHVDVLEENHILRGEVASRPLSRSNSMNSTASQSQQWQSPLDRRLEYMDAQKRSLVAIDRLSQQVSNLRVTIHSRDNQINLLQEQLNGRDIRPSRLKGRSLGLAERTASNPDSLRGYESAVSTPATDVSLDFPDCPELRGNSLSSDSNRDSMHSESDFDDVPVVLSSQLSLNKSHSHSSTNLSPKPLKAVPSLRRARPDVPSRSVKRLPKPPTSMPQDFALRYSESTSSFSSPKALSSPIAIRCMDRSGGFNFGRHPALRSTDSIELLGTSV